MSIFFPLLDWLGYWWCEVNTARSWNKKFKTKGKCHIVIIYLSVINFRCTLEHHLREYKNTKETLKLLDINIFAGAQDVIDLQNAEVVDH